MRKGTRNITGKTETTAEVSTGERFASVWADAMPLMDNTEFVMKRGAAGTVMRFRLTTQSGPVNLTTGVVTIYAKNRSTGELSVNGGICTPHPNQFQHRGIAAYVFDEQTANIAEGTYEMEFVVTRGDGTREYYPTGDLVNFCKLTVKPSLRG